MKPSKETVKKLRRLQEFIRKEPRRFDMSWWGASVKVPVDKLGVNLEPRNQHGEIDYDVSLDIIADKNPPCGTVACLAGSALMMGKLIKPKFIKAGIGEVSVFNFGEDTPEKACEYLGIPYEDQNLLFYFDGWPYRFSREYFELSPKDQVERACKRLDYYIETGK